MKNLGIFGRLANIFATANDNTSDVVPVSDVPSPELCDGNGIVVPEQPTDPTAALADRLAVLTNDERVNVLRDASDILATMNDETRDDWQNNDRESARFAFQRQDERTTAQSKVVEKANDDAKTARDANWRMSLRSGCCRTW